MDTRLAVHAGSHRQKVSAWAATLAALALASPAAAAPKGAKAKAEFNRGVAAYQKQDYAAASEALAASFKLEADAETLFAWAQSERLLEHCDQAIELFGKLLGFSMPDENKQAVQTKIDECKAIIAAKQPKPEPPPAPEPAKPPEPVPVKPPEPPPAASGRSPWWKDPLGDGLVALGAVSLGAGGYFLVTARQAEQDAPKQTTDQAVTDKNDLAEKNGKLGVIAATAGGVLIVGGIVRYMTRGGGKERTAVTGWLAPDGGGFAAVGRF